MLTATLKVDDPAYTPEFPGYTSSDLRVLILWQGEKEFVDGEIVHVYGTLNKLVGLPGLQHVLQAKEITLWDNGVTTAFARVLATPRLQIYGKFAGIIRQPTLPGATGHRANYIAMVFKVYPYAGRVEVVVLQNRLEGLHDKIGCYAVVVGEFHHAYNYQPGSDIIDTIIMLEGGDTVAQDGGDIFAITGDKIDWHTRK